MAIHTRKKRSPDELIAELQEERAKLDAEIDQKSLALEFAESSDGGP